MKPVNSLPILAIVLLSVTTQAHIAPISIPSDQTLQAGTIFDVQWQVTIYHGSSMDTWDLAYSTESSTTGFIDIQTDIPTIAIAGNPEGIVQSYAWTVPDIVEENVWIRVDNGDPWIITSPQSFAIVPEPATLSLLALGALTLITKRNA